MKRFYSLKWVVCSLMIILLAAFVANSGCKKQPKDIVIGHIAPLTGDAAIWGNWALMARAATIVLGSSPASDAMPAGNTSGISARAAAKGGAISSGGWLGIAMIAGSPCAGALASGAGAGAGGGGGGGGGLSNTAS